MVHTTGLEHCILTGEFSVRETATLGRGTTVTVTGLRANSFLEPEAAESGPRPSNTYALSFRAVREPGRGGHGLRSRPPPRQLSLKTDGSTSTIPGRGGTCDGRALVADERTTRREPSQTRSRRQTAPDYYLNLDDDCGSKAAIRCLWHAAIPDLRGGVSGWRCSPVRRCWDGHGEVEILTATPLAQDLICGGTQLQGQPVRLLISGGAPRVVLNAPGSRTRAPGLARLPPSSRRRSSGMSLQGQ